jgi:hypothetical protein
MKKQRSQSISESVKAVWDNPENKNWLKERNIKVSLAAQNMWDNADDDWLKNRSKKLSKATREYTANNPDKIILRGQKHSEFHKNRSREDKEETYKKYLDTRIKNGNAIPKELKNDYERYVELVWKYTNISYSEHYYEINPNNLKRGRTTYHLDHKVSIFEGFNNSILPNIIGSKYNLEILEAKKNLSKQRKSSQLISELLNKHKGI